MNDNNEIFVLYLRKRIEEQEEIFENAELAGDLVGMSTSFNRKNELIHMLQTYQQSSELNEQHSFVSR